MNNQLYVNLHGHSAYSILDSVGYPKDILIRAKELGFRSIAITDHGNMNMTADLYFSAKEVGIKPIYGMEAYFIPSISQWKKIYQEYEEQGLSKNDPKLKQYNHLILLAKNEIGLKNLYKLNYYGSKNTYYKPRIDRELLSAHSEGLICSTACIAGVIQRKIINLGYIQKQSFEQILENVKEDIEYFQNTFKDDFYFELQINELDEQRFSNEVMLRLAKLFNIKTIITNDSHYINKNHEVARKVMMMIREKITETDLQQEAEKTEKEEKEETECLELYLKTDEEIRESVKRLKHNYITDEILIELFNNTLEIDEKIENIKIDTSIKLIKPIVEGDDTFIYLKDYCEKQLEVKASHISYIKENYDTYIQRLKYELDIIKKKEIYDYFLVMKNIVDYAKTQMLTGVGRGSAAGALICYLLDITKVDPVKYGLLFFRFINLGRQELPDIDTDFENPEAIKTYLSQKYGESNVAYVSTYGTYQMKALLKDYCRAFNITENNEDKFLYANRLTSIIEKEIDNYQGGNEENGGTFLTYDDYVKKSKTLNEFMAKNKSAEEIVRILFNQIRQIGKHAAGIIIVNDLIEKMPLQLIKGKVQTPYTEGIVSRNLSKMGFVKFDLLGLNTLKIINDAVRLVSKGNEQKYIELLDKMHPDNIDFNDIKVYEKVFHQGNFLGIFQFSETGMQALCKQIKPDKIEEVSDIIALFRPGPLQNNFHTMYIKRKFKHEEVSFLDPVLKEITEKTYGLLVYQEQIMQASMKLGGLDEIESNELRKILVKLDKNVENSVADKILKLKNKFIEGAAKHKCESEKANKIWDIMERFSGYAFNLSHSLCYAIIAFQCAYLKTYYPTEFYCSLLTNTADANDYEDIFSEMAKMGIGILPPSINKSKESFQIDGENILFSLSGVQGIGEKTVAELIRLQPFSSMKDFMQKKSRVINKKVITNLIYSNCFMDFGSIGEIIHNHPIYSLVDINSPYYMKELSKIEKSLIKCNISFVSKELQRKKQKIKELVENGKVCNFIDLKGAEKNFYGFVKTIEKKLTKTGKDMIKCRLEDLNKAQMTLMIFSNAIEKIKQVGDIDEVLQIGEPILFIGKVDEFQGNKLLKLDSVYNLKKIIGE